MELPKEKTWEILGVGLTVASVVCGGSWWASNVYSRVASAEERIAEASRTQIRMIDQLDQVNLTLVEIKTELKIRNKAHHNGSLKGE